MNFEARLWQFLRPENWWLRHLVYWAYRYSDQLILYFNPPEGDDPPTVAVFLKLFLLPDLALVYLNLGVLVPFLLMKKRVGAYIVAAFWLIMAYGLWTFFVMPVNEVAAYSPLIDFYLYDFMDGLEVVGLTTGAWLVVHYLFQNQKAQTIAAENLRAEVAFLKHQISPHFLFNTLNNIAVQAELYPDRVVGTISELSGVLRYQLYEGEKDQVLLSNEIENLRQNLRLEALRLNDPTATIEVSDDLFGVRVAPLLFLPFVENAVKHSADPAGQPVIEVRFWREGKSLFFSCRNSKPAQKARQLVGGIGLPNVRRRLELLYPDRHELRILEEKDWYSVVLRLEV